MTYLTWPKPNQSKQAFHPTAQPYRQGVRDEFSYKYTGHTCLDQSCGSSERVELGSSAQHLFCKIFHWRGKLALYVDKKVNISISRP
jgi:hypothetical protein